MGSVARTETWRLIVVKGMCEVIWLPKSDL